MKLGEIIKNFREEKKLSMDRFAEKSGLTKGYISMLEKNEHPKSKKPIIPTEETLLKVAKGMGVDIDFVLSRLDSDQEIQINISPKNMLNIDNPSTPTNPQVELTSSTLQKINSTSSQLEQPRQEKVLSFANEQLEEQNKVVSMFDRKVEETENYITDYVEGLVAAGLGAYQEDNLHMEVKLRADDVPDKYDTIAKVAGNSMEPLIQDNDLLFVKVSSQVDMNDIGIFQVNGKNFVKKLKRDYDGAWYLQSLNKSYEEIYLSENDNIRTIGEVVDIYREN
ncbi:TPA: helix-turn-helix transcriptional regulator [Streptococcus agalactiae]|nr:helix-turn-helix transcriptional regulator [Streptococcus agalactiae]